MRSTTLILVLCGLGAPVAFASGALAQAASAGDRHPATSLGILPTGGSAPTGRETGVGPAGRNIGSTTGPAAVGTTNGSVGVGSGAASGTVGGGVDSGAVR